MKMHQILRDELNFDGVIMTDDLYMDAIKDYTGDDEAAVTAVLRVINNRGHVKPEIEERIQKIAVELGYRPNAAEH